MGRTKGDGRKSTSQDISKGDRPPSKEVADKIDEDGDKDDEDISSYEHENENNDNYDEENSNKDGDIEYKGKMGVEASDIPGKPIDPHLLCYYGDHIARLIWEISVFQEYVKNNDLYPLIKYGHHKIDHALINAFRERWYPETNTYHLPFGEMTPTIEDVERIIGLHSKGEEVYTVYSGKTMTWQFMFDLIKRTLGKTEEEIKKEWALCGTPKQHENKLKLNWLRDNFKTYLLYVIGSIICGDKSGGSDYAYFLQCLEDLEKVNTYSWATTCLAWMYNQLGQGSRSEIYSMAGCMIVLQVWVYDHFPTLQRHNKNSGYEECHPRASLYMA
ncbi:hypothetical protein MKX03_007611 [Papaver bracteatum]|nr:hypothetical protein MKX03_007611 [Papaver bracteatum]